MQRIMAPRPDLDDEIPVERSLYRL
jgi:hypothetical protein